MRGRAVVTGAVLTGAVVAVAIVLPVQLAFTALDALVGLCDDDPGGGCGSPWLLVFFGAAVVGWVVGGFVAGRRHPPGSLHGWLAALVGFGAVQTFGVIRNLLTGGDVTWAGIAFNALVASSAGLLGGTLADRSRLRHRSSPGR